MVYFTFTGDAYGDEVTHTFEEALDILEGSCNKPLESLTHLKKGIINSITVPEGKFTLHKFMKKTRPHLNKIPYSRN